MLRGTRRRNRYFTGFCQMLCLLLQVHLVPNTPTWGGFLLPVLMLVPYIMSPVRAMLFLCHQLHREGAQAPLSWGSQTLPLKQMLLPALQEYFKRKQCLGFLFKMQNCLLGVLHLLREQKARTHILEQPPGQCSFNTGQILLSFTHRYLERFQ